MVAHAKKKEQRKRNIKRWVTIGVGGLVGGALIGWTERHIASSPYVVQVSLVASLPR